MLNPSVKSRFMQEFKQV